MADRPSAGLAARVLKLADDRFDEIVGFAQKMVRTRSVNPDLDPDSPGEGEVAAIFKQELRDLGFSVQEVCVEKGRPNLISRLKGRGEGPRLLFNAHMDTVRAYETTEWFDPETGEVLTEWSSDPFGGEIRNDYLYGRGSCDHKVAIVAMIEAVRLLKQLGVQLRGDLVFVNDSGEETGSAKGLEHIARTIDLDVDAVVYACTTDITSLGQRYFSGMSDVNVFNSVSGRQVYRLRVYGRTYHTLTPRTGWNPAENIMRILPELQDLLDQENRRINALVGTGKPWMRLHHIAAPEYDRAADNHVDLVISRVIAPGEDNDEVWNRFRTWAENRTLGRDHIRVEVSRELDMVPYSTPDDHPLVRATVHAVEATRGETPNVAPMPTGTGISRLLVHQLYPTLLFGFGSVNFHHAIDERIPLKDIVDTAKVYALMMLGYLGYEQKRE